jgi:L-rhamnose mutarotase
MIRKAFTMKLRPGSQSEYERVHNSIWPELEEMLKDEGVWTYSIFLNRNTDELFAYVEVESEEHWRQIAETEICQKWWAQMKDLLLTNDDNSPVETHLVEVFHLD